MNGDWHRQSVPSSEPFELSLQCSLRPASPHLAPLALAFAVGTMEVMASAQAVAQQAPPTGATRTDPTEPDDTAPPTSTEQGQTHMDETLGVRSHAQWIRETRRRALRDTEWDVQLRTYYQDRERFDATESEAWALGGSAGLKTGYFGERVALGLTGYTSQRLHGPEGKDGTLLLQPGQHGYTVLGELYGEVLINQDFRVSLGRRGLDTPYINRNDARMTPNTFEAITFQGLRGGDNGRPEWRLGAGYVSQIKERNSDTFVPMSIDAGSTVERGVYAAGVNYRQGNFSIGAIDYYSRDIINIFYAETEYAVPLTDDVRLQFSLQRAIQGSTGNELLNGTGFSSRQWGGKAELASGSGLLTLAYTVADGDANMQNPWSGNPGYTSVQVEDFNRNGEEALLIRASYEFKSPQGLSVYGLVVDGSAPAQPSQFARDEYDLNLQWKPVEGMLKGLTVRLRYANVSQDDPVRSQIDDIRVMVYYDPPSP